MLNIKLKEKIDKFYKLLKITKFVKIKINKKIGCSITIKIIDI